MEEDHHHHHHHLTRPFLLLSTTSTLTSATASPDIPNTSSYTLVAADHNPIDQNNTQIISSASDILLRLAFIFAVAILSLWANQEASKGFDIHIENRAPADSVASRRFQLMYLSNDRATRLVLGASKYVETILYSNSISQYSHYNKQVNRVTVRLLGDRNLTQMVTVECFKEHEFVINLSPSILELPTNFDDAMLRAIQRGMARVWLHDNNAPKSLLNGMVEYIISRVAGLGTAGGFSGNVDLAESGGQGCCWMDEDPVAVARFLGYCEEKRRGFIRRLNLAMKDGWKDRTVDDALGMPAQQLCGSYVSRMHLPVEY